MNQRGTVSMVVVTGALVLALFALAAADLGALLLLRSRAQAAADAAALAAAVAQVEVLGQSGDPEARATRTAEDNGARLIRCECTAGEPTALVEVEIVPALTLMAPWFDARVRAVARAGVDPDVLSYRDA